jgi:hypothetical protein
VACHRSAASATARALPSSGCGIGTWRGREQDSAGALLKPAYQARICGSLRMVRMGGGDQVWLWSPTPPPRHLHATSTPPAHLPRPAMHLPTPKAQLSVLSMQWLPSSGIRSRYETSDACAANVSTRHRASGDHGRRAGGKLEYCGSYTCQACMSRALWVVHMSRALRSYTCQACMSKACGAQECMCVASGTCTWTCTVAHEGFRRYVRRARGRLPWLAFSQVDSHASHMAGRAPSAPP